MAARLQAVVREELPFALPPVLPVPRQDLPYVPFWWQISS